jgi:RNA polymerase sigma factor (sigma-70 family)
MDMEKKHRLNSGMDIDIYRKEISGFKCLTEEEERNLVDRIKTGDTAAKEQLIKAHLGLASAIAYSYSNTVKKFSGLSVDDLVQESNIALFIAAGKYEGNHGLRFSSYAKIWIRQRISNAIKMCGRDIRMPIKTVTEILKYEKVLEELTKQYARQPTKEEVSAFMGITPEHLKDLQWLAAQKTTSLNSFRYAENDDETDELVDFWEDKSMPSVEDEIEKKITYEEKLSIMKNILSESECKIMFERLNVHGDRIPITLREAGKNLGISHEWVRQVEKLAMEKLRRAHFPGMPVKDNAKDNAAEQETAGQEFSGHNADKQDAAL